jgi:phosphoglycolate phosphatase
VRPSPDECIDRDDRIAGGQQQPDIARPGISKAVLFDLDGTLLDSALTCSRPSMRCVPRAANRRCCWRLAPAGVEGRARDAYGGLSELGTAEREASVPAFLQHYERELGRRGRLSTASGRCWRTWKRPARVWGIVTNKPEYLRGATAAVAGLAGTRCAVLIRGDTLAARKPDPLPLIVAAQRIGVAAADCVYVGDDERDIAAARAAGMPSVVALWGYRTIDDDPVAWRGDVLIEQPAGLCAASAWPARR